MIVDPRLMSWKPESEKLSSASAAKVKNTLIIRK
jgi:hypothetical protein